MGCQCKFHSHIFIRRTDLNLSIFQLHCQVQAIQKHLIKITTMHHHPKIHRHRLIFHPELRDIQVIFNRMVYANDQCPLKKKTVPMAMTRMLKWIEFIFQKLQMHIIYMHILRPCRQYIPFIKQI